jgi:hypothetical protein
MGLAQDARSKQVDASSFWHIILPFVVIVILLFILFVIYTLPDWAISCSSDLFPVRELAKVTSTVE